MICNLPDLKIIFVELEQYVSENVERIFILQQISLAWSIGKEVSVVLNEETDEIITDNIEENETQSVAAKVVEEIQNPDHVKPFNFNFAIEEHLQIDRNCYEEPEQTEVKNIIITEEFDKDINIDDDFFEAEDYMKKLYSQEFKTDFDGKRKYIYNGPFTCIKCNLKFNCRSVFYKHKKSEHPSDTISTLLGRSRPYNKVYRRTNKENRVIKKGSSIKNTQCKLCGKELKTSRALTEHVKEHQHSAHPYLCKFCGMNLKDAFEYRHHIYKHTGEKPYSCRVCGKKFTWRTSLTVHLRCHSNDTMYLCDRCDTTCSDKSEFRQHLKIHDKQECERQQLQASVDENNYKEANLKTVYTCEFCRFSTTHRSRFEIHIRKHTKERPYLCNICGRGFNTNESVRMHMRTHTGEKPFMCHICNKQFRHKGTLRIHTRLHTGERPFACRHCDKSFIDKTAILRHEKSHEKYLASSSAKKQKVEDSSLYPITYQCSDCPKSFKHPKRLYRHQEEVHSYPTHLFVIPLSPYVDQSQIEPLAFEEIPAVKIEVGLGYDAEDLGFRMEENVFEDYDGQIVEPIAFEEIS